MQVGVYIQFMLCAAAAARHPANKLLGIALPSYSRKTSHYALKPNLASPPSRSRGNLFQSITASTLPSYHREVFWFSYQKVGFLPLDRSAPCSWCLAQYQAHDRSMPGAVICCRDRGQANDLARVTDWDLNFHLFCSLNKMTIYNPKIWNPKCSQIRKK